VFNSATHVCSGRTAASDLYYRAHVRPCRFEAVGLCQAGTVCKSAR
jgi:hypothetical protein